MEHISHNNLYKYKNRHDTHQDNTQKHFQIVIQPFQCFFQFCNLLIQSINAPPRKSDDLAPIQAHPPQFPYAAALILTDYETKKRFTITFLPLAPSTILSARSGCPSALSGLLPLSAAALNSSFCSLIKSGLLYSLQLPLSPMDSSSYFLDCSYWYVVASAIALLSIGSLLISTQGVVFVASNAYMYRSINMFCQCTVLLNFTSEAVTSNGSTQQVLLHHLAVPCCKRSV